VRRADVGNGIICLFLRCVACVHGISADVSLQMALPAKLEHKRFIAWFLSELNPRLWFARMLKLDKDLWWIKNWCTRWVPNYKFFLAKFSSYMWRLGIAHITVNQLFTEFTLSEFNTHFSWYCFISNILNEPWVHFDLISQTECVQECSICIWCLLIL